MEFSLDPSHSPVESTATRSAEAYGPAYWRETEQPGELWDASLHTDRHGRGYATACNRKRWRQESNPTRLGPVTQQAAYNRTSRKPHPSRSY
ncbi:MAG: hypothetical protein ACI9K3_000309 [Halovenus sp.]|mgnify:CR=1 FL=1|jgi:hypothetical protein